MSLRRLSLAVIALSLSACDLAPDYKLPQIAVPATYKETGPWRPAQPSSATASGKWWEGFGDSELDRLEAQIEPANPDLAVALAHYDEARGNLAASEAGQMPQLALNGGLSTNKQSQDRPLRSAASPTYYGANQIGVSAGYELDFWGKIRNQVAAGRAVAQASGDDLAGVRLGLQADLAAAYISLRGLDNDLKLLDDTVAAYEQSHSLTLRLFEGKLVSDLDVSRAETQLSTARAQVSEARGRRASLEHAIAALIGRSASDFSLPIEPKAITLPDIPVGLPSELLQRRPDIAAAERNVAAANAGIGVARAAFYPSFSLGLLGGVQSTHLGLLSLPDSFWSIGPDVSLPLFNGGFLEAQETIAYGRFREAGAAYRAVVVNAFKEVEDNLALLDWLARESTDEEAAAKAAQRTLDAANNLYHEGADSYLEVVTAQTALLQAQRSLLDLQTRRLAADVGLIRSLGGGWRATD